MLAGIITQSLGFHHGDQIAAIIVGAMIVAAGIKILASTVRELKEEEIDKKTIELITETVTADAAIKQLHKLRTRSVGREIFLDFHILVDPNLNVKEAHKISMDLENRIRQSLAMPVNIIIHIEPDEPVFRK